MNIRGISRFWYPLVKRQHLHRLTPATIRGVFSIESAPDMEGNAPMPAAGQARRSRLSADKRARMLVDLERQYEELYSDPTALAEDVKEGQFLDEAFNDPVIEE